MSEVAMRKVLFLAFFASLLVGGTALAQAKKSEGGVTYEKKTVINFEDDTIEGDLTKPDGEYVEARKTVRHSNLIKIREEFRDKVLQSVGEL
jgi:hypothetical protein